MKITVIPHTDPTVSLEDFADQYGLELLVQERGPDFPEYQRWYANFKGVSIINGHLETSTFGNGSTQYYAILDYVVKIQGQKLKHDGVVFTAPKVLKYIKYITGTQ